MNRIYQLTPVSMYDVRGLEQWLEQMAARGLFLKQYRPLICTFTKGEPKPVRYRLEPFWWNLAVDFPDDMVELFQECGWQYVSTINHEMLIFSSADPHAPEPHTDPDIQLEQWNKLYRQAKKDFQQMGLFTLACLIAAAVFLSWGGTPLTKLLIFNVIHWNIALMLVLIPLRDLGIHFTRARELAAVLRKLDGQPEKHQIWFPSRQFFSWANAVLFLFLLLLICGTGRTESLPQPVTEFPALYIIDSESGVPVGTDVAARGFSPLCWNQRQLLDFKTEEGKLLYLEVNWFNFPSWLSFLSVPAAKDLLTDSMKLNGHSYPWREKKPVAWATRDWPGAGADWLSAADSEDGVYHTAAAALGSKVVLVRYLGSGDLADYLDEIVDMVQ